MKKIIFSCALLLVAGLAKAQTPAMGENTKNEGSNNAPSSVGSMSNEFDKIEMTVKDKKAVFTGVPDVKNKAYVVLTNSAGETIDQAILTPTKNVFKLGNLPNDLYFLTIVQNNRSRKAFTVKI